MKNEINCIKIDKNSIIPIYKQIGDAFLNLIETGTLSPNSKLPAIRYMAAMLNINNDTVIAAYKYLENKKMVYSHVGSGTYVSPIPIENIPQPIMEKKISSIVNYKKFDIKSSINFVNTSLPEELFPVDDFKAAFNEILEREQGNAFKYTESQGYFELRESLCEYLNEYGIKSTPENIQVISGAQQGIDIISKALINFGDVIFMEKPSFYGAAGAFLSRGAQIIEIPMETNGMSTDILEDFLKLYRPKFIYIMAYFQTPTGISYSMNKKRKILELAEKYDTYIIEDDNLYDFNYTKNPIIPVKALDYKNRVIYVKSFSKILMPGLRIGFLVLPKKIMNSVMAAKYTTDISTSGFIQKAFDNYLRKNTWKNHIDIMRKYGKHKYSLTIKFADKYLKNLCFYTKPEGGISIWIELKDNKSPIEISNKLIEKGVIVSPGSQFYIGNETNKNIRLCFANVSDDKIEVGIKRLSDILKLS